MIIACPACRHSRDIPAERIPPGPKRVACPKCGEKFRLAPAAPEIKAEPAAPALSPPPLKDLPEKPPKVPPDSPSAAGPISMVCPHCNVRRSMPREKVPQRSVRVSCPQCRQSFTFHGENLLARKLAAPPELHPVLAAATAARPDPSPIRRKALSGPGALFGKSWRTFLQRLPTFLAINLVIFCLGGLGYLVLTGLTSRLTKLAGGSVVVHAAGGAVSMVFLMVMMVWANAAMTYAIVDEDLGVRQSLGYGLQRLGSFLWISLLVGFMITGGSLLLLIPGLMFTVWFLFAPFILAREDARGMEALLKSKAYVAGRGWPVFGRLLLVGLLTAGISVVLAPIPLLGALTGLFLGFFLLVYYAEIQKELAEIKGDISFDCSRGVKLRWLLAGGCGFVLAAGLGLVFGGLG